MENNSKKKLNVTGSVMLGEVSLKRKKEKKKKFKIGQKVICKSLVAPFGGTPFGIKLKKVYEISNILYCEICGAEFLTFFGVNGCSKKHCAECDCLTPYSNIFMSWRFENYKKNENRNSNKKRSFKRLDN